MALPILGKRRERKQAELQATIDAGIEKAVGSALATMPSLNTNDPRRYSPNWPNQFNQMGGNFSADSLPRPPGVYDALFGPVTPLLPEAINALRPDGRADPRRWEIPVAWNLQFRDREVPWAFLRKTASDIDVVARCIELVQDAIAGMSWSWGFSRQIINQIRIENNEPNSAKATVLAREKYGDELGKVQKFFERPDEKMGYTFSQWLTLMVWAQLVYDGIVISPSYTLGGDLHSLSILDTSTIKILLDNHGFLPQPPAPAYQQILYGFPRGEFQAEVTEDGEIPNAYRNDQLAYYIRRPRLHTPYGFSAVEECLNYATMYASRQQWMHAEWSHGVTPKMAIETQGTENWTPEQYAYFQQALNDQWSGQLQRRQQAMILMPGMKPTQLHEMADTYKSDYDSWLVLQIGSKFGVPQSQLGIPMNIRSISTSNMGGQAQMDLTDKFALDALVNFLVDSINDLARRFLKIGPEITITAAQGNSNDADLATAQADASDVDHGIRTRNEVRAERGIPLITEPEADQLGVTSATGVTFLTGTLDAQQAQLAILENRGGVPADGRQRSSRSDEPADPDAKPTAALPRGADTPHKSRNDPVQPDVTPKVPGAQQGHADAGSYTEKELATFTKFAKSRQDRTWRDFEFNELDSVPAALLNWHGHANDPSALSELTELIKAGVCTGPGPCDIHEIGPGPNWVTRVQGLPKYIRAIAHALLRSGYGEADAIKTAVATVKRWAAGGGKVTEATRQRAANAVAEWEEKKAEAHATKKSIAEESTDVKFAALAVKAKDTRRVLMVQRSIDNHAVHVAGKWEFPGGSIEEGEDPLEAAKREWTEEVGVDLPDGEIAGSWVASNSYECFVYLIDEEADLDLENARSGLDDSGNDEIENVAWWNLNDIPHNPAVRVEVESSDWALLGHAKELAGA